MQYSQLDPWQKEALEHKGHILLCTGRQSGKTFLMARKASDYMLKHPNCRIIVVSLTEDQAELMIIMILDYLEKNHKKSIAIGLKKPTKKRVYLKNGAMCLARPVGNTGDAVRGFTGDVLIVDEASRMPELAFTAAKPTLLTTGGEIWMCSTPFGKRGYFWESYQNKNQRFKVIHTNSEEVMASREITETWTIERREGALRMLAEERADMTELQYGQEYLGLFLDDLQRYFPDKLIDESSKLKRPTETPYGKKYLGVDIARLGKDEGTLEVINDDDTTIFKHIENIITKKQLTTETERRIIEVARRWGACKVGIDAGAGTLGVSVLDHLLQTELKHKVIAMNNRAISLDMDGKIKQRIFKEDLYENLRSMLEHGELLLLDDPEVRLSLASVQYEFSDNVAQTTKVKIFGNYTHVVEGLIRAAWLAKKEKSLNLWAM